LPTYLDPFVNHAADNNAMHFKILSTYLVHTSIQISISTTHKKANMTTLCDSEMQ